MYLSRGRLFFRFEGHLAGDFYFGPQTPENSLPRHRYTKYSVFQRDNFDRSFVTSDLAFVVAPLTRGGGEAENSWTRNYPTQGLPVSTTSVCLRFSVA